jgi:hypothetical protein
MISELFTKIAVVDAKIHVKVLRALSKGGRVPLHLQPWGLSHRVNHLINPLKLSYGQWANALQSVIDQNPKNYPELISAYIEAFNHQKNDAWVRKVMGG